MPWTWPDKTQMLVQLPGVGDFYAVDGILGGFGGWQVVGWFSSWSLVILIQGDVVLGS